MCISYPTSFLPTFTTQTSEFQSIRLNPTMSSLSDANSTPGASSTQPFTLSNIGTPVITSDKLIGSVNYLSWATFNKMWFKGQGQVDLLTKKAEDVDEANKTKWEQVDAKLCNILWNSIDRSVLQLFRPFETCYEVWKKVIECYTNNIQRLYTVVHSIKNI